MCWIARLHVVPVTDKRLAGKLAVPAGLFGELPDLSVGPHCACDFVKDEGRSLTNIPQLVEELVTQSAVKRVEVAWWWGDHEPTELREEKVEVGEFARRAERGGLTPKVLYRVNDSSHWVS